MIIKGIVIDFAVYRDSDEVLTLLCEDGTIMPFYAKGIRKSKAKNKNLSFVFQEVSIEYIISNKRNILIGGKQEIFIDQLLLSFNGLLLINFIKEICFKVLLEEEIGKLYRIFHISLTSLRDNFSEELIIRNMYKIMVNALLISGYDYVSYCREKNENIDYLEISNYDSNKLIVELKKMSEFFTFYTNIKLNSIEMLN